jgi:hypothetical protein
MAPNPQDACALPRKKTVGRPKLYEPRCHQLNLSLTTPELASIQQRASALGMRTSQFGRAVLMQQDQRGTAAKRQPESNHQKLIYGQLVRLGNNLNQLVRHLHRTGEPLPGDLTLLLHDIRRIISRVSSDDR